ncbi:MULTISPECIES: ArsR/SmtB family transcription factor [Corynebacterium]|uniref:Transcriptional repressor SdpR n=2 Tax=Corynebacterium TaxID=1716 RepID=A0A3G6IX11_9CORY|nr:MULTISPECIES: metalloregulator ArsR/SmtB family transcription factor [Corynebacterium]AZA10103.1 Transcriptional repressor SdpR [Corynebacterium pseudopelargi]QAU53217.1 Transcriptional repressor SdpR [Corynebacterium pelargi]GGG74007.1 transcriptional regulator [Corynebacterium pelargi]
MTLDRASQIFKALGDPTRLQLLQLVAEQESICGVDLAEHLAITAPTVTHHMQKLAEVNLVQRHRQGKWTRYQVNPGEYQRIAALIDQL